MSGFGGMISFLLHEGRTDAVQRFFKGLTLCNLAVSLGSVDTLVEQPSTMTHAVYPKDLRGIVGN